MAYKYIARGETVCRVLLHILAVQDFEKEGVDVTERTFQEARPPKQCAALANSSLNPHQQFIWSP
jgi:hypothetical protein